MRIIYLGVVSDVNINSSPGIALTVMLEHIHVYKNIYILNFFILEHNIQRSVIIAKMKRTTTSSRYQ